MKARAKKFTDPGQAVEHIQRLYQQSVSVLRTAFQKFVEGHPPKGKVSATYPAIEIEVENEASGKDARHSFGFVDRPGIYRATLTRPEIFERYLREQLKLLVSNHGCPIKVGLSEVAIPIHFAFDEDFHLEKGLSAEQRSSIARYFDIPDIRRSGLDNTIVDAEVDPIDNGPLPLALFSAPRIDRSLQSIQHYTGTSPRFFQSFIIFTNYADYMDRFRDAAQALLTRGAKPLHPLVGNASREGYLALVEPGNVMQWNENVANARTLFNHKPGKKPGRLPQMPAYHLIRADGCGISIVNIGVGPSNAKNITDHLAVLRPHAWLMLGHCAGLRHSQALGHYVLANAYVRRDKVLDEQLPLDVPIPPLSEVQVAIQNAIIEVVGLSGSGNDADYAIKNILRTGTVVTEVDRNWELESGKVLYRRFSRNRAIALDMESATIAANGFRYRIPYGALLCVSDKPLHGELKLPGMSGEFYRQRVSEHFWAGFRAMELLREEGVHRLHSRKLRAFDEPALR